MVTFINEMLRVILISFFVIAAAFAFLAVIYFGAVITIWDTYAGIFYAYALIILSVTIKRMASANTN